jgi:hypothetical protein
VLLLALVASPAAAGPKYDGYLFFYFTGEGAATGEQVYLAASRGDDPLHGDELNAGAPVRTVLPVTGVEPARVRAAYS